MTGEEQARRLSRLARHVLAPTACSGAEAGGSLKPFSGIRVIDCTSVVAGPTACAILADMGADVVKIEPPGAPDITRGWGNGDDPEFTAMPGLQSEGMGGSCFVQCNRGKRSLALDFGKPSGVALLKRILAKADVLVTNIRLRSLQKAGMDYESLAPEFPRLVYAHLSAFGRSGPLKNDPGYDIGVWWATSGLMDLARSSEDGDMPRFPGAMGDNSTGVQLAGFIGTALFHRERTGRGQLVDAALMRSGIFAAAHPLTSWAGGNVWGTGTMNTGGVRGTAKLGERTTLLSDAPYRCKDGVWVQLLGIDIGRHLGKVLRALRLKREDLTPGAETWEQVDWRLATRVCDGVMASKTYDEWHEIFVKHDVWHVRINRFEDMLQHEQALASGIFVQPEGVRHKLLSCPVRLSSAEGGPVAGAPTLGQHTTAVLREHGISPEEEEQLRKDGIVK
mmetsp:Transcript_56429/g.168002  ORF Transcript_56429/g.168002 Transcript_56429/m.168002 type:complete len:449 (-) Transcript_56429:73-1419(-)